MPGVTYNIRIVLSTEASGATGDLDGVGKSAEGAGKKIATLGDLAREAAANFAGYLSAQGVFMALSKAAEFAKETILGFDDAMTQSLAIMGDVSTETRKSMETTARETAVEYNTAVADVAQGYYYLISAGYDAAASQAAIGQVTAFAKAGMFDLEKATELAADAQNAMGLKSDDAGENLVQLTRITDVLTKANIDANGSVEQFAVALTNKAAAASRLAGISLESTVAVLETFAAQGLKGKRAGEAFSIVLRDLQEKSQTNKEAFKALGIEVYTAEGAFSGFSPIVKQLEDSLRGMSVEQANATISTLGFTVEGSNYLKTLIGMSGEIARYEEKLKSARDTTQQVADRQMQSMIEKMKHMQAAAAELALQGFDLMIVAIGWLGDNFGPAVENGAAALRDLAIYAAPIGKMLAMIAGASVVGSLKVLATVLQTVTGFIRDNAGAVQALATVGFVFLTAHILSAAAAYGSFVAMMAVAKWEILKSAIIGVATAYTTAASGATGLVGSLHALRVAIVTVGTASVVATAGLAALGLILYGAMTAADEGKKSAQAWIAAYEHDIDTKNFLDLKKELTDVTGMVDALGTSGSTMGERFGAIADLVVPFHDIENSTNDAMGALEDFKAKQGDLQATIAQTESSLYAMAKGIAASQGPAAETEANYRRIVEQLTVLAATSGIDITGPLRDWEGALKKAYDTSTIADPTILALHEAFSLVADSASTADDAVKAYKSSLDALMGVHIAEQEAENTFAAALDTVHEKVGGGINLLDAYNVKSREGRDAVLAGASAALGHAVSLREEGASAEQASAVLGHHVEQLVASMVKTGMAEGAARAYLATLGLTPQNIETTAKMNKDAAQAAAEQLTRAANEAARNRSGVITVDVSSALANLNTLQSKLGYVSQLMRSGDLASGGRALGQILGGRSEGGITLHQYASGGIVESHVAQISPPGTMRVWSEPETGGEAYIPLANAKRDRSTAILGNVASMFGYGLTAQAQTGQAPGGGGGGGGGMIVAPGAVQVTVNNPATGVDVSGAVDSALQSWSRQMRNELRTRRFAPSGPR